MDVSLSHYILCSVEVFGDHIYNSRFPLGTSDSDIIKFMIETYQINPDSVLRIHFHTIRIYNSFYYGKS